MARFIIGLLIGLVIGGAAAFYVFVGVLRADSVPGTPIAPPDPAGLPPGTAEIVLRQDLFNTVLDTIFRDTSAPTFPLTANGQPDQGGQPCRREITILREGSGVRTAVRFDDSRISAPLAFSGSYNSILGCIQFTGWAQANLGLRYDAAQQVVYGQLNVETVNLDGVNPVIGSLLTPLVQTTLNNRVNPITIVDGRQIAVSVPVAATGGNLQAGVSDVRAEIKQNELHLYVVYDFRGIPMQPN